MSSPIDDVRVEGVLSLLPPSILMDEVPVTPDAAATIAVARMGIENVLDGQDDRLLIVVGPCSIHDPEMALEYARNLRVVAEELAEDLLIVMRVYFEKPRTTVGWKGLVNDPWLDGSFAINEGLRIARRLLVEINELGVPAACEFLDPISPQYLADAVSWGAIGARTTESQTHRELASGLSMPVGFKNGTSGSVQIAVDAVGAARRPHHFLGITKNGVAAIIKTRGNPYCHVVLRGGATGPNYTAERVADAVASLGAAGLPGRLMVDCSHGNAGKDYTRQPMVAAAIADQVASGGWAVAGVMIESALVDGKQELGSKLVYGQSVTDACIGWDRTIPVLQDLARAVRARRRLAERTSASTA